MQDEYIIRVFRFSDKEEWGAYVLGNKSGATGETPWQSVMRLGYMWEKAQEEVKKDG